VGQTRPRHQAELLVRPVRLVQTCVKKLVFRTKKCKN
jgi:hypothetical protein